MLALYPDDDAERQRDLADSMKVGNHGMSKKVQGARIKAVGSIPKSRQNVRPLLCYRYHLFCLYRACCSPT